MTRTCECPFHIKIARTWSVTVCVKECGWRVHALVWQERDDYTVRWLMAVMSWTCHVMSWTCHWSAANGFTRGENSIKGCLLQFSPRPRHNHPFDNSPISPVLILEVEISLLLVKSFLIQRSAHLFLLSFICPSLSILSSDHLSSHSYPQPFSHPSYNLHFSNGNVLFLFTFNLLPSLFLFHSRACLSLVTCHTSKDHSTSCETVQTIRAKVSYNRKSKSFLQP